MIDGVPLPSRNGADEIAVDVEGGEGRRRSYAHASRGGDRKRLRQERSRGFVGILFFPDLEIHLSRSGNEVDLSRVSAAFVYHRGRAVVEIVESDSRSPSEKRYVRSVRRIHEIRHVYGTSGAVVGYGKSRLGSCGIDSHEIRGDGNRIQFRLEIG